MVLWVHHRTPLAGVLLTTWPKHLPSFTIPELPLLQRYYPPKLRFLIFTFIALRKILVLLFGNIIIPAFLAGLAIAGEVIYLLSEIDGAEQIFSLVEADPSYILSSRSFRLGVDCKTLSAGRWTSWQVSTICTSLPSLIVIRVCAVLILRLQSSWVLSHIWVLSRVIIVPSIQRPHELWFCMSRMKPWVILRRIHNEWSKLVCLSIFQSNKRSWTWAVSQWHSRMCNRSRRSRKVLHFRKNVLDLSMLSFNYPLLIKHSTSKRRLMLQQAASKRREEYHQDANNEDDSCKEHERVFVLQ